MFDAAFIEERGNGRLMHESRLVRDHCLRIGLPVHLFTPKRIRRRQLPLNSNSFVFGDMDTMHGAMRQLGVAIPSLETYPPSLEGYLRRKVWQGTLTGVLNHLEDAGAPIFAKPASRAKAFTGRVFAGHSDFAGIGAASWREPVWCSDVVSWTSEHRIYVLGSDIVSIDHYEGDPSVTPDLPVVEGCVRDFLASGEAPAAFAIDFGVLRSGETALVEVNDGYGLGAYQIGSEAYGAMMVARWRELLDSKRDEAGSNE